MDRIPLPLPDPTEPEDPDRVVFELVEIPKVVPFPDRGLGGGKPLSSEVRLRLLEAIAESGRPGIPLDDALRVSLDRLRDALGWPLCRLHHPGAGPDVWRGGGRAVPRDVRDRLAGNLDTPTAVAVQRVAELEDEALIPPLEEIGVHHVVTVPAIAEGRPIAALQFLVQGPVTPGDEVVRYLSIVSNQLGHAAARARVRAAIRNAARHARAQQAELEELQARSKLYDARTGLPRGSVLEDRIRQAIHRRGRHLRTRFAVLRVGIEGLDRVRRTEDDETFQVALVSIARRLKGLVRSYDTVAHGADGFVVLLEGIGAVNDAADMAERLRKALLRPFPIGGSLFRLEAHVGVVFGGPAYDAPETLLLDADTALTHARRAESGVHVFDGASDADERKRRRDESEIARALEQDEYFLEYQPIVSLHDGRITGLEAFVRWRHPERGLIPPEEFVPLVAASPLVHEFGYWILERTCVQLRHWQDRLGALSAPPVALNVAGRQLFHDLFVQRVRETLERTGIRGNQIRFDVSEADLLRDAQGAAELLDRVQGMGIRVAVDDFGTGSTSLNLLHSLPVHALKIDRSFVSQPRARLRKWGVARTIVELARFLEVTVIAEGIETREQFLQMREAGCSQAQGFYFSGPVGPERAEALIRDGYPLDLDAPSR